MSIKQTTVIILLFSALTSAHALATGSKNVPPKAQASATWFQWVMQAVED